MPCFSPDQICIVLHFLLSPLNYFCSLSATDPNNFFLRYLKLCFNVIVSNSIRFLHFCIYYSRIKPYFVTYKCDNNIELQAYHVWVTMTRFVCLWMPDYAFCLSVYLTLDFDETSHVQAVYAYFTQGHLYLRKLKNRQR